jgi:hypothetical protein
MAIGYNGQPVIFYAARKKRVMKPKNQPDARFEGLADILRGWK